MGVLLVILALCFLLAFPILGALTVRRVSPDSAAMLEVIHRTLFLFGALVTLIALPRFTRVFEEFGTDLPLVTEWVLGSANLLRKLSQHWTLGYCLFGAMAVQVSLFSHWIQGDAQQRKNARRLSITVTCGTFLFAALIALSMVLPLVKLLNDLSTILLR